MDDDSDIRGPDGDMGSYVEDARGYDPEESEDSIVDKVKNALGGDTDSVDEEDEYTDDYDEESGNKLV